MAKFKDRAGREWAVGLTVGDLPRLRAAGWDLSAVLRQAAERPERAAADLLFVADPEAFGRVLWVLCEGQADRLGVTPEAFAARFDGPALFAAADAVVEAIVDFRHRPAVATAIKTTLPPAVARVETELAAAMTSTWRPSAGGSPVSPG